MDQPRRRVPIVASLVAVAFVAVVVVILLSGGREARRALVTPQARPESAPSALALRTWPTKVPVGGSMFWEGAVLGSSSAQLVVAQVRRGERSWNTFATLPASESGHYCLEYPFFRATHPTTYTFRAYVPGVPHEHIASVASNEVRVVVGEGARQRGLALAARLRHMRAYCPETTGPAASD